jgi:hypothetical protein
MLDAAKLKDEEDLKRRNAIVSSEASRVERTPWLNRTNWLKIFDGRDMKLLVECTSDKIKDGECLEGIKSSVKRVIKYCIDGVKDLEERGWGLVRFWLKSTEAGKADSRPFNIHYDDSTVRIRGALWTKYLFFCIRALDVETGVQFTEQQSRCLSELRAAIVLNELTDEQLDKEILRLSALLILHSDYEHQFSSIKYFLRIMEFNFNSER